MKHRPMWSPGDHVVYRDIWRNQVWSARPMTVVEDTPHRTVLYQPAGSVWKRPVGPRDDLIRCLQQGDWQLVDATWQPGGILYILPPNCGYAVWVMHDVHEQFSGWYINLQAPLRRSQLGFDSMDQELDVVVAPDCSHWQWKDAGELREAQARGLYTAQQVAEIWAAGHAAVARLAARDAQLFDAHWTQWSPPADWPLPQLPTGWDTV